MLVRRCIAVIGDIISSRELPRRAAVQRHLDTLMVHLNEELAVNILSRFTITLGDEFQGLLRAAEVIPDLIWQVAGFQDAEIRLGFGYGSLSTPLKPTAIQMDGPAFHNARSAIEVARRRRVRGGIFVGFGDELDVIFNGFSRLLERQLRQLTKRQLEVLGLLRSGLSKTEATLQLGVTKPAVTKSSKAAGWAAYTEGERGFRTALKYLVDQPHRR